MTNYQNRRRWAASQKNRARNKATAEWLESRKKWEAEHLDGLHQLAAALALLPHMAGTLTKVRAEIARLEIKI
jgi:hypothetical protein